MKEILKKDNQFGRFLFGICSNETNFKEIMGWLKPMFEDTKIVRYMFRDFLYFLSDYSKAIRLEIIAVSLDQLQNQIENKSMEEI